MAHVTQPPLLNKAGFSTDSTRIKEHSPHESCTLLLQLRIRIGLSLRRTDALSGLPILEMNDATESVAKRLVDGGLIPATSAEDAL